ncbi:hypothetical protein, partial [Akkermansia sp.]|uniref:hypothetical protein n=1 Tax=Akkermansia sp. TaxID=1872421 RepID=UPI003FD8C86C
YWFLEDSGFHSKWHQVRENGAFFLQMTGVVLRGKLRPRGMNAERLSIVLQSIEKLKSHVPR